MNTADRFPDCPTTRLPLTFRVGFICWSMAETCLKSSPNLRQTCQPQWWPCVSYQTGKEQLKSKRMKEIQTSKLNNGSWLITLHSVSSRTRRWNRHCQLCWPERHENLPLRFSCIKKTSLSQREKASIFYSTARW